MGTTRSRAGRLLIVLALCVVGALSAVGCLLATMFELQGFGAPRDSEPRLAYLLGLGFLYAVSAGAPLLAWRALLPENPPGWKSVAVFLGAAVVLIFGLGLSR